MASGTLAVGGLMSGIDTESMFAQLREAYRKPVELMEERKTDYNVKLSAYSTLQAKLTALRTAAKEMDTSSEFTSLSATSTDETVLTATATSTAKSMSYNFQVTALAQANKVASARAYSSTETLGTGTMTIQVGNGTAKTITIDSGNNTVQGIADEINGTAGMDVVAATVYDGSKYTLMISAKEAGDENIVNIAIDDGDSTDIDSTGLSQLSYDNFKTKSAASYETFGAGTITINNAYDIIVSATDTMQDIVDKINDSSNWYDKGSTTVKYSGSATIAKASVVTDISNGKVFIRADGVDTWDSDIAALEYNDTFQQNNMYFQSISSINTADTNSGDFTFNGATHAVPGGTPETIAQIATGINGIGTPAVTATTVTDSTDAAKAYLYVTNVDSFTVPGAFEGLMYVNSKNMTRSQYSQDATVVIDGATIKRSSNTIDDMLTGVTLNLNKTSYNTTTLSYDTLSLNVAKDSTAMVEKFETIADAYNDLVEFFEEYQGVQLKEDASAKTLEDGMKDLITILSGDEIEQDDDDSPIKYGPLMGDSTTSLIKSKLFNLSFRDVAGVNSAYNNLTEMGISLNFGKMSIDKEKLTEAISADSDAIIGFFTNDTTTSQGFAVQLIDAIDNMVENYAGDQKGILLARQDGIQSTIDRLDEQIARQDARIEAELERTRAQFNSLEVLMGKYQTTSSYLASQLASMAG
ncbi:MAG: flagellar filament capping protein FliD [Candidatus Magnetomorum sp.]|nr:flagellar filament capping protein FliD [Candidatus Magnetomorum sp.]